MRHYRLVGAVLLVLLGAVAIGTAILALASQAALVTVLYGLLACAALLAAGLLYLFFRLPGDLQASTSARAWPSLPTGPTAEAATGAPAKRQIEYGLESRDVEILEGIGTVFSRRLARAGIATLDDLRRAKESDIAVAAQVHIPVARKWQTMARLMLVREVDAQAAELLVACGVDSVDVLARQEAAPLTRKARDVNRAGRIRIYPMEITTDLVNGWITAAAGASRGGTAGETGFQPRTRSPGSPA